MSKRREGAGRRLAGGQHFSRGALYLMLQNRLYRGDIVHQGEPYPGQHDAILDPEVWQIVQKKLAVHRQERAFAVGAEAPSLLAGWIVDADGSRMTPTDFPGGDEGKPERVSKKLRRNGECFLPSCRRPAAA